MWFAALLAALGALMELLPAVKQFIDPKFYGFFLVFIGVVVAVLRVYTTVPLKDK